MINLYAPEPVADLEI